jgi:hypothetical protein
MSLATTTVTSNTCANVTLKCNASTIDNVHVLQNMDLTWRYDALRNLARDLQMELWLVRIFGNAFEYYRPAADLKAAIVYDPAYLVGKAMCLKYWTKSDLEKS